jgi:hypothetical protein
MITLMLATGRSSKFFAVTAVKVLRDHQGIRKNDAARVRGSGPGGGRLGGDGRAVTVAAGTWPGQQKVFAVARASGLKNFASNLG